jgi:hypothetical protein
MVKVLVVRPPLMHFVRFEGNKMRKIGNVSCTHVHRDNTAMCRVGP